MNKKGLSRTPHYNLVLKNQKGLSTLVTSLILILLVLVAIGIFYAVYLSFVEEGTQEISIEKFTINIKIKSVKVNYNNLEVNVVRNSGEGELTGIKFIISNGFNTTIIEKPTTMKELENDVFVLDYIGLVKDVLIAPIYEFSGSKKIGDVADKEDIYNSQPEEDEEEKEDEEEEPVIENLGAMSWWKFEGNADDEIGDNDGTLNEGVNCDVEGKDGMACEFDGFDDYISVDDVDELSVNNTGQLSVSFWFSPKSFDFPGIAEGYIYPMGKLNYGQNEWAIRMYNASSVDGRAKRVSFYVWNLTDSWGVGSYFQDDLNVDEWVHVVAIANGTHTFLYKNGVLRDSDFYADMIFPEGGTAPFRIGTRNKVDYFNGSIDDVRIWNRSLSLEEVKALYALY